MKMAEDDTITTLSRCIHLACPDKPSGSQSQADIEKPKKNNKNKRKQRENVDPLHLTGASVAAKAIEEALIESMKGTAHAADEFEAFAHPSAEVIIDGYQEDTDIERIKHLMNVDLSEPYSVYTYRYFIHGWPKLCFLARVLPSRTVIGAIVCKIDNSCDIRRGYIAMLDVHKAFRRRGIALRLVRAALDQMVSENCDEVVLETEASNIPASTLYSKLGFIREKRLFRYYLNGSDAFRLKLYFTEPRVISSPDTTHTNITSAEPSVIEEQASCA